VSVEPTRRCTACGAVGAGSAAYCTSCGSALAPRPPDPEPEPDASVRHRFCARCGATLVEGAAFCTACGRSLAPPAPLDPVAPFWVRADSYNPVLFTVARSPRRARVTVVLAPGWWLAQLVTVALGMPVSVAGWLIRIAAGRLPDPVDALAAHLLDAGVRTGCFGSLLGFPGEGLTVDAGPRPSGRFAALLRPVLIVPALAVGVLEWAALIVCFPVVLASVVLGGRVPDGVADVLEQAWRYGARLAAYGLFLTDAYPWFQPAPEPVAPPAARLADFSS
jgi:Domain of unknown function (DUF4389)/Double zinc ribbon